MDVKVTSHDNGRHAIMEVVEEGGQMEEEEDCEVELVVQGRTIEVSEKLLCEHSVYFRKIFRDFDSESQETIVLKHSKVAGQEIPLERQQEPLALINFITMTTIVEFLYSDILAINDYNVRQLLYASELLSMGSVEAECFIFLKKHLTIRNCVKNFLLASDKKSWRPLADFIKRFIIQHFSSVVNFSTIFKQFDVNQMNSLISSPSLAVRFEEEVLESVLIWVRLDPDIRGCHLYTLFTEVQWSLIRSMTHLKELTIDPLVLADERCLMMVEESINYINLTYEEKLTFWSNNRQKPSRWPKLLATLSYAEKLIECYDFEEEEWFILTEKPGYVFGSSMVCLGDKLYTLGGVQSKSVEEYDPETDTWADFFPSLRHCRVAHGVTTTDDKIYVTGGSAKANANFGPGLYEMEVLDMSAGQRSKPTWREGGKMKEGRSFLGSVAISGHIYQIGGCLSEDKSTCEVWDPVSKNFKDCAKSLSKRDSQGQAVINGELYVVGGYDNISDIYLATVEKYDPVGDRWSRVPSMSWARRSAGVVNYRDRLYAVAGMGVDHDLDSVEVYCPTTNLWTILPNPLKEVNGWCSSCLIDKPLRLMESVKPVLNIRPTIEGLESPGDSRRGSAACTTSSGRQGRLSVDWTGSENARGSASSSSGRQGRLSVDWTGSENARTEQRMKKNKELQKLE